MAEETTRTDGASDAGVVDIGYHYPTLFMLPDVRVSTDKQEYRHGETVEVRFEAKNPNLFPYPVDVYAGILTPDGALWTIGTNWTWSMGLNPWFTSLNLPPLFLLPPTTLLTIPVPSDLPPVSAPGTYWVAAAFAHVGTASFISEPSLNAFHLRSSIRERPFPTSGFSAVSPMGSPCEKKHLTVLYGSVILHLFRYDKELHGRPKSVCRLSPIRLAGY
jgi:hypothetical protein